MQLKNPIIVQIIPTILSKNFHDFENTVRKIENDFEMAQIDVMDGKFVKNKTFYDLELIMKLESPLLFELHLMVSNPEKYIKESEIYSNIRRIFFHFEAVKNHSEIINVIHSIGKQAGMVLNPETRTDKIKSIIDNLEAIMIMGVKPGFSGQKFFPETIERVAEVKKIRVGIDISVDGGIDDTNAQKLVEAGATLLSVNSFLYKADPLRQKEILLSKIYEK